MRNLTVVGHLPWFIFFACLSVEAARAEVKVPRLTERLVDTASLLSRADANELEGRLARLEAETGAQLVVLTVPSTQPETIEQFALRVAEAWKIGRDEVDDGVILVVAKNDRKVRIEVGYGLEGAIPDARAKQIIRNTIAPHFKQGNFKQGIQLAIVDLELLIRGEELPHPANTRGGGGDNFSILFSIVILSVFVGGLIQSSTKNSVVGSFSVPLAGGIIAWIFVHLLAGLFTALVIFVLLKSGHGGVYRGGRGFGGYGGGGFGGGGGFSGGGGSFGGGGASGGW